MKNIKEIKFYEEILSEIFCYEKDISKLQGLSLKNVGIKIIDEKPQMLTNASECLANMRKAQIHIIPKDLTPSVQTLKEMTDKFSRSDTEITQDMQQVIAYLRRISFASLQSL